MNARPFCAISILQIADMKRLVSVQYPCSTSSAEGLHVFKVAYKLAKTI